MLLSLFEVSHIIHLILYNIQGAFSILFTVQMRKSRLGANNYSNVA